MRPEEFIQYARSRGYKIHENIVLGVFGGYPFHMSVKGSGGRIIVTTVIQASGRLEKQTLKEIKSGVPKKTGITKTPGKNSSVTVVLSGKDDAFTSNLEAVLKTVTRGLKNALLQPPSTCAICKSEGTDAFAWHDGSYTSVHKSCMEQNCQNTVTDLKDRQANGSYLRGFIGALLGAIVGAIPNFLSIYFAEYIIGYLCALIPLASYFGYRLFKGKPNKPATVIILFCSVIQVFVLEIAVWYAYIVKYMEFWPSVTDVVRFYFEVFDSDSFASLMQIGLFVVIGIAVCFAGISRTADKQITSAMSIMDTMSDRASAMEPVSEER